MNIPKAIARTAKGYSRNNIPVLAAALAFYALFSIGPLILLTVFLANSVINPGQAVNPSDLIPSDIDDSSSVNLQQDTPKKSPHPLVSTFGILIFVFAATKVLSHLQYSFDTIWNSNRKYSFLRNIRNRLSSLPVIIILGLAIVLSLFANIISANLSNLIGVEFAGIITFIASFVILWFVFAAIYKTIPRNKIKTRNATVSALFATILFQMGQTVFSIYVQNASVATGFGAASGIVILLVYVYYSSLILLAGAQFCYELQ